MVLQDFFEELISLYKMASITLCLFVKYLQVYKMSRFIVQFVFTAQNQGAKFQVGQSRTMQCPSQDLGLSRCGGFCRIVGHFGGLFGYSYGSQWRNVFSSCGQQESCIQSSPIGRKSRRIPDSCESVLKGTCVLRTCIAPMKLIVRLCCYLSFLNCFSKISMVHKDLQGHFLVMLKVISL